MSGSSPVERVPTSLGATIGAACGLLVALVWSLGLLRPLDLRLHDWRYRLRGPIPASDRIALVELDAQTLRAFHDVWPLPRGFYAIAIDALENAGAQAIALDVLFTGDIEDDPDHGDQLLAQVTGAHDNIVQAIGFQRSDGSLGGRPGVEADTSALIRHGRPVSRQRLAVAQSVSLPYDDLLASSRDLGHTAVLIDADGVIRRIPQFVQFGEWAYPSLVMRLVEVAARNDSTLPQFELDPDGVMIHWHGRRLQVPCDDEGATSIAFAGDQNAFKNRYSMLQLLQWYRHDDTTAIAKAFRGKLVLLGVTAVEQHVTDVGATPYSSSAPLVYIHANAVNAALRGQFLTFVPAAWLALGIVLLSVALGLLYSRLSSLRGGLVAVGALLLVAAADFGLFVFGNVDLPGVGILLVPPVTWIAVENAWRRDAEHRARVRAKELDVARSIQEHLLPGAPPKLAGLDVAGRNLPAESIGGDYFDWVELEDDSLAVVVGDVSGHGIPAALLMAHLRASFQAEAKAGLSPADIVASVNRSLARAAAPGKFATFFLAMISVKENRIRYCNAGHNSPLLLRDGKLRELGATGVPLGVMEDMPYGAGEETFEAGDTLVIYSDGIPEAPVHRGATRGFYGDDRLGQRVVEFSRSEESATAIVSRLLADVRAVSGEGMHVDDVTLVVVRRT